VIADWDPLVVGQQGIIGPEQAPDCGRMMNGNIEIGVIADLSRQCIDRVALRHETLLEGRLER
jgi:hypothetical protein